MLPAAADRPGNQGGIPFLAVVKQNPFQFLIGPFVHHLIGGKGISPVHTHIQGGIRHIGKAPAAFIQLGRGNPQIQQHAVHAPVPQGADHGIHFTEITVDQGHPIHKGGQTLPGCRQGRLIPVNADQMPGGKTAGNLPGVSAAAQGAVHIDPIGADSEGIDARVQENGNMMKRTHRPIASREARSFSGLRFSSSNRANSDSAQISAWPARPTIITSRSIPA